MATHVYANGREIASQSADGVAPAAFPDACWSPPPPPAGPVVIPYANFTRASKLRNGTRRIFIKGKTVALENKSYFVNSTGNEPATYAFGKGLMTGALKGKAYFQSWSLTVLFEGRGVARHHDLVSHNHGSDPGNTAPFPYIARSSQGEKDCAADKAKIEKECGGADNPNWAKEYCSGLDVKLSSVQKVENYASEQSMPSNIYKEITNGLKKALDNVPDEEVKVEVARLKDLAKQFMELRRQAKTAKKAGKPLKELNNNLAEKAQSIAAGAQDLFATLDECIRARKCQLVPYSKGKKSEGRGPSTRSGCCPGQTGHHLIYDCMVQDKVREQISDNPKKYKTKRLEPRCPGYDYKTAPTVCVEGTTQHHGSHGRVHRAMDKQLGRVIKEKIKNEEKIYRFPDGNAGISVEEAIDAAVKSHGESFKASKCDRNCIRAQLVHHYSKMCAGATLKAKRVTGGSAGSSDKMGSRK